MLLDARAYLVPAGVVLVMLAALNALTTGFVMADTFSLLDGTAAASHCIDRGVWSGCGAVVSQYGLLQYLPTFVLHETGFSYRGALETLVALNGLACLAVLGLVVLAVRKRVDTATAAVLAVVMLAGPLLWYSNAGFGEPLATLAVTGFVVSLLLRAPPLVTGVAMALATVSKETAVLFLLGMTLAIWLIRRDEQPVRRAEFISIAAGGAVGVALNLGFNIFRYGDITNDVYSDSQYHVGVGHGAENVAALLLSPTGGLLWIWPAALVVLGTGTVFAIRRRQVAEPGLVALAVFLGILLVTAAWYAPFGGVTWGPRLLLPWLPGLMVLMVCGYPAEFRGAVGQLLTNRRSFAVLVIAILLAGLPQIVVTADSSRYPRQAPGIQGDRHELVLRPFRTDASCPEVPAIEYGRAYYFRCTREQTWAKGIVPASAYTQLHRPRDLIYGLAWCLAVVGLLQYARVRARAQLPALA